MSIDGTSNCNADTLATNLFNTMTSGTDFSLPDVDLTGPEFSIPDGSGDLFSDITKLTPEDLTTRTVNGSGMFDGLMQSVKEHLKEEYEKGRLTGQEYSTAYVQLTTAAMGNAVQYLLSKDQSYYAAILAQKQAQAAEVAVIQARVQLESEKVNLVSLKAQTETRKAEYALSKLQLSTQDAQYCQVKNQADQIKYQTENLIPAQVGQIQAETNKTDYEVTNLLPAEVSRVQKQIDVMTSEISLTTARKDQVLYETANILPAQKANVEAETNLRAYQLSNVLPAQVANTSQDTLAKEYETNFIMPAQKKSIDEQAEAHRAKTLDSRSDGAGVAGSIGKQKELHQQQIESYQADAASKVAKMLTDTWITGKSMDEAYPIPGSFTEGSIDSVFSSLRSKVGV